MSDDKRKRSPNWAPAEKKLLLELVELHFYIIGSKKTDGASMKTKLARWQTIADQYNSRTMHCSRTAENLRAQWDSLKKMARKEASNNRMHKIQTGGGPSRPPKEDPFLNRILSLITTSAVGLFNPHDSDNIVPASISIPDLQTEDIPEPIILHEDPEQPLIMVNPEETSDIDMEVNTQDYKTQDWANYTPQLLKSPLTPVLKVGRKSKLTDKNKSWISRRRPTHTPSSSSLEQLYKKKIEALDLQKKLAIEEMERSKERHELKQEKIKTNILLNNKVVENNE